MDATYQCRSHGRGRRQQPSWARQWSTSWEALLMMWMCIGSRLSDASNEGLSCKIGMVDVEVEARELRCKAGDARAAGDLPLYTLACARQVHQINSALRSVLSRIGQHFTAIDLERVRKIGGLPADWIMPWRGPHCAVGVSPVRCSFSLLRDFHLRLRHPPLPLPYHSSHSCVYCRLFKASLLRIYRHVHLIV
jgi:hypothetical protein